MLFLDEPTAFLPAPGRAWLFDLLREAASEGVGVVLVSHDVAEVLEVTDRVTVLRDGRNAGTLDSATSTGERLVRMIVGDATFVRPVPAAPAPSPRLPAGASVADVWGDAVRGVSFELRSGEVVGLTGVGGSGYEELPYLLCGARRARAGTLYPSTRRPRAATHDTRASAP